MVSSTLCPTVHILGSQNVYSRAEGIADLCGPWAVFSCIFSGEGLFNTYVRVNHLEFKKVVKLHVSRRISALVGYLIGQQIHYPRVGFRYATIRKSSDIRYQAVFCFNLALPSNDFFIICLMISDSDIRYPISDIRSVCLVTRMQGEARPARHVTCQYSYSSIKKIVQLMTHKEKKKLQKKQIWRKNREKTDRE